MLDVLQDQGAVRAFVVHGEGGLDEVTPTGETHFVALQDGIITEGVMTPEDFGLPRVSLDDLKGGDALHNAMALEGVLSGEVSAYRVAAVMNAAVALVVAGSASDFFEGAAMAEQAIANGQAMDVLRSLRHIAGT
jgi:anthranilate phosphoribosyltransferase